ncbi:hypothetical protein N864_05825 [Intrasporangium chromatireducens Q5-1]|uniref:Uncharacterized protein n=1 Tax=Intrasporangium chromatireducens Q5-1 TaxID=584657 RepID=W9GJ30_9MICO|nr:hypothetical protein [Intrasporangium chromatireducens]EWT04828.1 hypothetical protein N864_05825 [Intrasporangium chromatireducens Q5-1]
MSESTERSLVEQFAAMPEEVQEGMVSLLRPIIGMSQDEKSAALDSVNLMSRALRYSRPDDSEQAVELLERLRSLLFRAGLAAQGEGSFFIDSLRSKVRALQEQEPDTPAADPSPRR